MKFRTTNFSLKHLLLMMLFISSCEILAQTSGLEAGIQALEKKEYSSSLRIILPLAEKGDPEAQVFIAYMYEAGLGVQKDFREAFVWYEKAAAKGQVTAQFNIAYLYKNGLGVSKDDKQAAFWYEKAANNGFAPAQNNLAYMYEKGMGVTRNYLLAASWYQKAADQGHKNAQINLAFLYENGLGVPKDIDRAIILYERALLATEKLSSDDVKFAQDRLDAIRATLIKKDFIEPRKKADAPTPVAMDTKKEIYSEVVVAPDLSETRINRSSSAPQPAQAPQAALKSAPSAVLPSTPSAKQVEKKEIASAPVVAASAPATKPEIASSASQGPSSNPVAVAASQVNEPVPTKPARVAAAEPLLPEADAKGNKKTSIKSKDTTQASNTVASSGPAVTAAKPDISTLQNTPSLPVPATTVAPLAPSPKPLNPPAPAVPPSAVDVTTPIKNPENLPIYGPDGRPIKLPVNGSLALKGIQNDFEDLDSSFWLAKATVLIVDPANNYLPYSKGGVTVRGYFEPTGGDTSCVTDEQGKCTLVSAKIRTNVGSVRMKVYSVSR